MRKVMFGAAIMLLACASVAAADAVTPPSARNEVTSVYQHLVHQAVREPSVDWAARIDALLTEQPGDVVITAVGDMIFNEPISQLEAPER
ncbi:MAG: hypothetical protein IT475_18185, partial [Aquimonas sp.]|nr:hypothetical protein [Aquimonas sp.]